MAMQYDKKQLEILIMEYFRRNWPEFPKSKVESTESPDFTISLNNRNFKIFSNKLTTITVLFNQFHTKARLFGKVSKTPS